MNLSKGENSMYNEERKLSFINQFYSGRYYPMLTSLFSKTNIYEEMFEKDVSDFNDFEIDALFKSFGLTSLSTLETKASILRTYANWSIENNLIRTGINFYNNIKRQELTAYLNTAIKDKKIINREQLLNIIEDLVNPCDKYFILALFEGAYGENLEEIISLKESDIDEENNLLKLCSGRNIKVSNELITLSLQSCRTYDYTPLTSEIKQPYPLLNIETAIKGRFNTNVLETSVQMQRLRLQMGRIRKYLDTPWLTIPRIRNSGMFYSFSELAKSKDISVYDAIYSEEGKQIVERFQLTTAPATLVDKFKSELS